MSKNSFSQYCIGIFTSTWGTFDDVPDIQDGQVQKQSLLGICISNICDVQIFIDIRQL